MSSARSMLRAAASPERFLDGFARFLSRTPGVLRRARKSSRSTSPKKKTGTGIALGVALPNDLIRFLEPMKGGSIDDFVARPTLPSLSGLMTAARKGGTSLIRLIALLAGAVPFGETHAGEVVVYFLADPPARGLIVAMGRGGTSRSFSSRSEATLAYRSAAELAVACSMHALEELHSTGHELELDAELDRPSPFNIADEEAIHSLHDRARALAMLLTGTDAQVKSAIRVLARKPLDVPPPAMASPTNTKTKTKARSTKKSASPRPALAFGPLFEAFFREGPDDLGPRLELHSKSADALVRETTALLASALLLSSMGTPKKTTTKATKAAAATLDLARRRDLALKALRPMRAAPPSAGSDDKMAVTRDIIARFDALPPTAESYAALHDREETLLALTMLGDRSIAPVLLARALTGDAGAVDMLAALGDSSLIPHLGGLLGGEPSRVRLYEAAVVRMLAAIGAKDSRPALRRLLEENPMTGWREGLERGVLVRELVIALGELEDESSAPLLLSILESTSQEYRAVLPAAAYALGRLRHVPALAALERLLFSPKDPVACEAVWAVGAIGHAHPEASEGAAALLDRLAPSTLDPGVEVTRLTALAKLRLRPRSSSKRTPSLAPPKSADLRRAIDRALWEPGFRQEETSRRRVWGLRALEELAPLAQIAGPSTKVAKRGLEAEALFLGHEAVRHFVTRDDHRVRKAAERAFAAWGLAVPKVRHYFSFTLAQLEQAAGPGAGLDMLLEAVRDPLGVFRHNVATRLAEIGDVRSTGPLAEATARLFSEPPTSTYEYDDAPPHLVAFVRSLSKLNRPESNAVLIDGLRSENHQVRAVIAENAPDDERFVPELMAMLGDPRSFLRSRAEKSLTSLGAIPAPIEPGTTEVAALPAVAPSVPVVASQQRIVEG